jgi:hypothetical protein
MAKVGNTQTWDFEDLAIMGAAGLAAKAVTNPVINAVYKAFKMKEKPKYTPVLVKGALALGLHYVKDPMAQTAKKGVALAAIFEAGDLIMPKLFNPVQDGLVKKLKAAGIDPAVSGCDDDDDADEVAENVTIDLNSSDYEVSGYTTEYNEVSGHETDDVL